MIFYFLFLFIIYFLFFFVCDREHLFEVKDNLKRAAGKYVAVQPPKQSWFCSVARPQARGLQLMSSRLMLHQDACSLLLDKLHASMFPSVCFAHSDPYLSRLCLFHLCAYLLSSPSPKMGLPPSLVLAASLFCPIFYSYLL